MGLDGGVADEQAAGDLGAGQAFREQDEDLLFAGRELGEAVGHVALSLGLRRTGVLRSWWVAPLVAAAALLLGIVVPADLWHHLGLFTFDAAWVALGAHLLARARAATAPRVEPSPL